MTAPGARGQTGAVAGTVHDSIADQPLSDAAVFLWETPYRAVSDDEGRFRIEGVPEGEYRILFFHTRLGELGISPGPRSISVGPGGDEARIELATPSMATVVSSQCLLEEHPEGTGVLAGWVRDEGSGTRLGGSTVSLSWESRGDGRVERRALYAAPDGWYYTCSAPAGVPILVSASFLGRESLRREVSVAPDGFLEADLSLDRTRPTDIRGRLRDATTGAPVESAEVRLRGTDRRGVTDHDGSFELDGVAPGSYMLVAEHLAYGRTMDTLAVPDGVRLDVEMRLDTRAIPLAPLTVTVSEHRPISAGIAGGIVITREEIDQVRQRSRDASDIIRSLHVPGVLVRHQSNGTICVGYSAGQVKMNQTGCVEMMIYVNDVRAVDADLALRMPPDAIERMVIYKPVEAGNLFGLGGGNGVWMIYTRGN